MEHPARTGGVKEMHAHSLAHAGLFSFEHSENGNVARIKTIRPLVRTLKPRMSAPKGEKARLKERDETQPWRRWYYTAQWQKLRQKVWERDQYTCKRTGTLCIGKYPAGNSPVANHIIPHKGDPELFWDINNIETVAKSVHDSLIQSEERRQGY